MAVTGESVWWSTYDAGAVADLNGDGRMEIVIFGTAWENQWVQVFEHVDDTKGPEAVLGAGCGV